MRPRPGVENNHLLLPRLVPGRAHARGLVAADATGDAWRGSLAIGSCAWRRWPGCWPYDGSGWLSRGCRDSWPPAQDRRWCPLRRGRGPHVDLTTIGGRRHRWQAHCTPRACRQGPWRTCSGVGAAGSSSANRNARVHGGDWRRTQGVHAMPEPIHQRVGLVLPAARHRHHFVGPPPVNRPTPHSRSIRGPH